MQCFGSHSILCRSTAENSTQPSINLQLIKTGQIHIPLWENGMLTIPIEGSGKSASPEEGQAPGSADLLREGWESAELRGEDQRGDDPLPPVTSSEKKF